MTRQRLAVLLLLLLGPACRSAGPPARPGPPALPEPLAEYTGQIRILPGGGEEKTLKAGPEQALPGGCALAVHVRAVEMVKGAARFSLDTVGLPKVRGRAVRCQETRPGLLLFVQGLTEDATASETRALVDRLLQTPEVFLQSKGVSFEFPPGEAPTQVASREPHAGAAEHNLGRLVQTWPEPLLTVAAWYHQGSDKVRQEGEVKVEAVVGADGRIHESRVMTGMGESQEQAVLRVMPLWRFEPAQGRTGPVAARLVLSPILRIF